jgi:hypothetical protein
MIHLLMQDETNSDWKILDEWANELAQHGLETEWAHQVRAKLRAVSGVLGVKGCGAGLNDAFLVALHGQYDRGLLEQIIAEQELQVLGTLGGLTLDADPVSAFAPVNIAWIKYMGKQAGKPPFKPANASYSLTLDDLGTLTTLEHRPPKAGEVGLHSGHLPFFWNPIGYIPPEPGREKMETWMRDHQVWSKLFQNLGYSLKVPAGEVWITTYNSAPPATGIATSASGFAAMAMAWAALQLSSDDRARWFRQWDDPGPNGDRMREALSEIASLGSGSAGRSLMGPWVVWNPKSTGGVSQFQKLNLNL